MTKKSLIKSASIISAGTLLSRVLGFIRDVVQAKVFGTGWFVQAFFVAFRIPNMFRELAAEGASNAALVPVFSEYLATKSRREFWKLVNTVFIVFLIIVTLIALTGVILSAYLVRLVAPGFIEVPQKLQLTIAINRPLFAYLILVCVASFVMGVLYSLKSFVSPSLSPCIFNIAMITSIMLADNSISGIWKLVVGVIIAGTLQIIVQLPALFKQGFSFRSFEFEKKMFAHPGVRLIGRLLVPRMIGTAVYQLNVLIDTVFASLTFLVGPGAIAAIYYASRMIQFPLGIFGHSISNAALPHLSELSAQKSMQKFAEIVEFSLTNILFIMIPASFGLMIMSQPIIKLIFERGQFDQYSTTITSTALAFYAIGLGGYAVNKFLALCFNSLQDTITPVKISGLALVSNIILNVLFTVILKAKIAGLAFASSLSAILAAFILYNFLHKRITQIDTRKVIDQILRMLLAGLAMAITIFIVWHKLAFCIHPVLALLLTICIGIAVYVYISLLLNVYQATKISQWILKKK